MKKDMRGRYGEEDRGQREACDTEDCIEEREKIAEEA